MSEYVQSIIDRVDRYVFPRRLRRYLHGRGLSFISQNCIGSRFSQFADEPYLSPTIGLWFKGDDFTRFSEGLPRYLGADLTEDQEESGRLGYPVGRLDDIQLMFLHYPSFEAAKSKWVERRRRVRLDRVVLLATDKNGATDEGLAAIDRLPYPKLIFTARPRPAISSAVVITRGSVNGELEDLYGKWHFMAPVVTSRRLAALFHASSA